MSCTHMRVSPDAAVEDHEASAGEADCRGRDPVLKES